MKTIRTLAALCAFISVLAACEYNTGTILGLSSPQARFINADSIDVGGLDYYLNSQLNTSNVPYKGVTRYQDIGDGSQTASYNLTGTPLSVASQSFNASDGHHYITIALPANISVIDDPYAAGLFNQYQPRLRAFNALITSLDVYVVPPGTGITLLAPTFSNVAYQNASPASGNDSLYANSGAYQIIVTTAGSKTPLLTTNPVQLGNGSDWLLVMVPDVTDVLHVLVAQGNNANAPSMELGPE